MLYTTTLIALLSIASHASAHMMISKPAPYTVPNLQFPLLSTGANFPCNIPPGEFDNPPPTLMALGSNQPLEFIGGATHGGGSCQISITYDQPPTAKSIFKVIHSIEGGCPTRDSDGNMSGDANFVDPDKYNFTVPTNIPTGKATIVWTWFNKVGNREMYMNCGPITLTGGSSKRSGLVERDQNAFNSLPNMFTANILNIGSDACTTTENIDLQFPNPGASVDTQGGVKPNPGPPSGTCVEAAGGNGAVGSAPSSAASSAAAVSVSAGVFATVAASSPAPAATTVAPVTSAAASPTPAAVSPLSSPASAAPAASASPAVSSGSTAPGSPCSPEGLWNCVGGNSFQQCGSGTWSVVEQMAAGTTCTPGQSATLNMATTPGKRAVRFSSEHVRRHLRKSA